MASQRNQHNICETNVTSVKVHHAPGGQSNWTLGWGGEQTENTNTVNRQNSTYPFIQIWNTTIRARLSLVRRCPKSKGKSSFWRRKNSKSSRNSTIDFPPTIPKMEGRVVCPLEMKRLTIVKRIRSSLQSKLELLQEENQVFNRCDSIINMSSQIIPYSNIFEMFHRICFRFQGSIIIKSFVMF